MRRAWMPWGSWVIVLVVTAAAWGDGGIRNGLGARSMARGGTNLAHADNGELLLDNPAAAVNIEGSGLADIGVDLLMTDLDYADPAGTADAHHNPLPLAQAAFVKKSPNECWAFGLGFFVPAGLAATYDLEGPFPFPGLRQYKSLGTLAKVLPVVAYRLNDRLSIGGTLGVGISHVELEGPYFLQSAGPFQGTPMLLDVQNTGAALCWSIGIQYQWTEETSLGLCYQSESRFYMDGRTRLDIPLLGTNTYDSRLDVAWPQSLGLGIRHEFCGHRVVSADVIWFNWSNAFDTFDLHLSNPTNPLYPPLLDEQFPLHWRDSVSVRLGYERLFENGRALRFGYVYHPDPIPTATLSPFIQTIVQHSVSTGFGLRWRDWDIDLAYMYCFGPSRTVEQSGWIGGDFDQSWHRAQAHWLALSFLKQF